MSGRRKPARSAAHDEVPYERLTPDVITVAVERVGFETTGSILALASYENRVYQIGVAGGFVVTKFYPQNATPKKMIAACERSLRRLGLRRQGLAAQLALDRSPASRPTIRQLPVHARCQIGEPGRLGRWRFFGRGF